MLRTKRIFQCAQSNDSNVAKVERRIKERTKIELSDVTRKNDTLFLVFFFNKMFLNFYFQYFNQNKYNQ